MDIISLEKIKKEGDLDSVWSSVLEIFFEASPRKNFDNQAQKDSFSYKYLTYYKDKYPDIFLVCRDEKKILGYICGSPDSINDEVLYKLLAHYQVFEDLYSRFPAHLHINLSSESRGLGVGSKLVENFESIVKSNIHIITGPSARNKSFYLKNEFNFESIKPFQDQELLFMGKLISQ